MSKGIFITGTGTDIGKTYVTGLLLKKLVDSGEKATYYKAALSGAEKINGILVPGDSKYVLERAGLHIEPESVVSYIYERAVSPHLASRIEGNPVNLDKVKRDFDELKKSYNYIIAEGSGGIICPIVYEENNKIMLEDIIKKLDLDVIIVADAGLGTINSTVLTYRYLESIGIDVKGIILNNYKKDDFMHIDNVKMIEEILNTRVLVCVEQGDTELNMNIDELKGIFKEI